MTDFVTTALGDRIGYDRVGDGPAVIFVAPAGQSRAIDPITAPTAKALAHRGLTALVYDRVGRGDSPAEPPITLERELAAIDALIDLVGPAILVGWSSGAAIALAATVRDAAVTGLVLFEAPLDPDGTGGQDYLDGIRSRVQADELEAAVEFYMQDMPPEWLAGAKQSPVWPVLVAMAPSLEVDAEALAWAESAPHAELFGGVDVPVLVLNGSDALDVMNTAATSITAAVQRSSVEEIAGENHGWAPDAFAERVAAFAAAPVE